MTDKNYSCFLLGISAVALCAFLTRSFNEAYYMYAFFIPSAIVSFIGAVFLDIRYGLIKRIKEEFSLIILFVAFVYTIITILNIFPNSALENELHRNTMGETRIGYREICAVFGSVFMFVAYYNLATIAKGWIINAWKAITRADKAVLFAYPLVIGVAFIIMLSFTTMFLSLDRFADVIFSADTGKTRLLVVFTPMGDIDYRSPFAFLTILPFIVPARIISYLFFFIPHSFEIGYVVMQAFVFFLCALMLAKMLKLEGPVKFAFVFLFLVSFVQFIFVFVIERFIFGTFWIILALFLIVQKKSAQQALMSVAAGIYATSILYAPFASNVWSEKFEKFKTSGFSLRFAKDMIVIVFVGLFLLSVSGQMNFVVTHNDAFDWFGGAWSQKLIFYTHMLADYFVAPSWRVEPDVYAIIALTVQTTVNYFGIAVFTLAIASFVFCRKDKFAQICLCGVGISTVLFPLLGLGVGQNEMIIYALHFNWPFIALIFMGANKFFMYLDSRNPGKGIGYIFPVTAILSGIVLLVNNTIEVVRIVEWGVNNW